MRAIHTSMVNAGGQRHPYGRVGSEEEENLMSHSPLPMKSPLWEHPYKETVKNWASEEKSWPQKRTVRPLFGHPKKEDQAPPGEAVWLNPRPEQAEAHT